MKMTSYFSICAVDNMVKNHQTENVREHQVTGVGRGRTVPKYSTERPSVVQQQGHVAECEQGQYSQRGRGDKGYYQRKFDGNSHASSSEQPHGPAPGYARSGLPHPSTGNSSKQRYVLKGSSAIPGGHGAGMSAAGASSPPAPDLHQASVETSLLHQSVDSSLARHFEQVSVDSGTMSEAIHPVVPAIALSSKSLSFPLRPGKGSIGIKCVVKANHFLAELPDKVLHHYDVSFNCLVLIFPPYILYSVP